MLLCFVYETKTLNYLFVVTLFVLDTVLDLDFALDTICFCKDSNLEISFNKSSTIY